jgi:hypothetical protein
MWPSCDVDVTSTKSVLGICSRWDIFVRVGVDGRSMRLSLSGLIKIVSQGLGISYNSTPMPTCLTEIEIIVDTY